MLLVLVFICAATGRNLETLYVVEARAISIVSLLLLLFVVTTSMFLLSCDFRV